MKNKEIILLVLTVLLVSTIIVGLWLTQQPNRLGYQISGIEEGGYYSGTAFCNIIDKINYTIVGNLITIYNGGPYEIKINEMKDTFSPYEYPNIKLILRIRFENKDATYADVLYIGDDNNLYECHGKV